MKKQLYIYATLIIIYLIYNFFFKIEDEKINAGVDIIFASIIFGYIAFLAWGLLKKMNKKS